MGEIAGNIYILKYPTVLRESEDMYSRLTYSTNLRGICPWSQPRAPTTGPHCSSYFRSQTSIHGYAMSTKPQQGEFDSTGPWTLALQKPSCRELAELLRIQSCNGICFALRSEPSSRKSPFKWARPSSAHVFPKDPGTTKRSFGDQPSGPLPTLCSPGFARPSPSLGFRGLTQRGAPLLQENARSLG